MSKMRMFSVPKSVACVALLLCLFAALTEAEYFKYKDPKQPLNVRIRDLMKRMTLAEKIGQMSQIERKIATPEIMKNYFIGMLIHCSKVSRSHFFLRFQHYC